MMSSSILSCNLFPTTLTEGVIFALQNARGTLSCTTRSVLEYTRGFFAARSALLANARVSLDFKHCARQLVGSNEFSFLVIRSTFFSSAGICGYAATRDFPEIISWKPMLMLLRDRFFLTGSLIALTHYCAKLNGIGQIIANNGDKINDPAILAKCHSAILGVLSSLSGLLMSAVKLFGSGTALVIVLGGIATATSCLQMIYDLVTC